MRDKTPIGINAKTKQISLQDQEMFGSIQKAQLE
jgi:hypothetical protein